MKISRNLRFTDVSKKLVALKIREFPKNRKTSNSNKSREVIGCFAILYEEFKYFPVE